MNQRIIVHSSISESIHSLFPQKNITISQDGMFDLIIPKRSVAYKILQFPPDFSKYKQVKSYKHIEILLLNCPEEAQDDTQMQALPLPVAFVQNLQEIFILLSNSRPPSALPSKADTEVIAKFIQIANSCSEYDALLEAQNRESLADYFSK
jgi:hypothetical protein